MQATVDIIVNNPTASPLIDGNLEEVKKYMEQAKEQAQQAQKMAQQAQSLADRAAGSADSAAESAGNAFAAAAELWQDTKIYNAPDVVAGSNGNTYRCIGTSVTGIDPTTDDGTHWKQITYNVNQIVNLDSDNNVIPYPDTTGVIAPNDIGGDLGTNLKRWTNVYAKAGNFTSLFVNGQNIESLANGGRNILQRQTTYVAGDVCYSPYLPTWGFIECTTAGVTGTTRPSDIFTTIEIGTEYTDGTVVWILRHLHDGHVAHEVYPLSGASFDGDGWLIHPVLKTSMKDTHICDGTNGTPDLRGRFILGKSDSYAEGTTGGEFVHQLTVGEMPAHNHSTDNQGGHNHDIRTAVYGGDGYKMSMGLTYEKTSGGTDYAQGDKSLFERGLYNLSDRYTINVWMTQAGVHAHTVSNTGGGQAHNNMPPFYTLVYVMKIK